MVDIKFLENKILKNIPILQSLGIEIIQVETGHAILKLPLQKNHNHKGTAFGGSLYSACTAASYTLLYHLQMQSGLLNRDLVITQGSIQYIRPVTSDFYARAKVDIQKWQDVVASLKMKRAKRLEIHVEIYTNEKNILCQFGGEFAFLPKEKKVSGGLYE